MFYLKSRLKAEGFAVDVATDFERGRFLGMTNDYDLLILDYNLASNSGLELCKILREAGKEYPILISTGEAEVAKKVETLDAGADDYLVKPYEIAELLARMRALIRRRYTSSDEVLNSKDITVDLIKREVKVKDNLVDLSKKEFALLEFFMRNENKVLTRDQLLEHVWDVNADPFSNTVDVYVRYLRKKIDEPYGTEHIVTVHGVGYKFV